MPDEFTYDVFLSHGAKDKAVGRESAEPFRRDPQSSTLNPQPARAPLNQERRFIPLRLGDVPTGWQTCDEPGFQRQSRI